MKNQLTELLTNYGEVSGIWFDGYWDQMEEEKLAEVRKHIWTGKCRRFMSLYISFSHNVLLEITTTLHHWKVKIFRCSERDIPGQNEHGLSFQKPSQLPLETCATLNDSWGFDLKDNKTRHSKSF